MRDLIQRCRHDEAGATSIEYGMIAAFISLGIIVALQLVGGEISGIFTDVESGLKKRPAV